MNTRLSFFYANAFMLLTGAAVAAFFALSGYGRAEASAPIGLPSQVATTSTLAVGPGNNVWALGTTSRESAYMCSSRIISTAGQPIMISFASVGSTTLSQTVGHLQGASTTVAYDGGLYGCGYMTIRGIGASTTITLTETK